MSWRAPARRYPVLAIRDFRLLLVDRLLAPFSIGFSLVGVSFAVLKVTGSTADLSYVIAAQTAPMLVFSLVSGVFADRFRPQRVIMAGNLAVVVGEGVFGLLMLVTGHPPLWAMICLEAVNGIGGAVFYPASQALLPQLVPDTLLQEGSSISRLAMNIGQMTGAAAAGVLVAVAGPGWALTLCAAGMSGTVPLMLAVKGGRRPRQAASRRAAQHDRRAARGVGRVHQAHLAVGHGDPVLPGHDGLERRVHGARAGGGQGAPGRRGRVGRDLRRRRARADPRRPHLAALHAAQADAVRGVHRGRFALSPLMLGLVAPLPVICLVAFGLDVLAEVMMVQWTVAMATRIPSDKLARVSSYDAFGSLAAMPLGALVAGPLAAGIGVPATQFAAAAVIFVASAFTLIPRDIWTIRSDDVLGGDPGAIDLGSAGPAGALPGAIASAQAGADLG